MNTTASTFTNNALALMLIDALEDQDSNIIWFVIGELEKDTLTHSPAFQICTNCGNDLSLEWLDKCLECMELLAAND